MLFSTSHILLIVIYFRPSLPQEGSQVTTLQRKKKKSCETVSCYSLEYCNHLEIPHCPTHLSFPMQVKSHINHAWNKLSNLNKHQHKPFKITQCSVYHVFFC